jgi:hypothetical protein
MMGRNISQSHQQKLEALPGVALPKDAKPITTWPNEDEAFLDVAHGIQRVAEELRRNL